jgi:hypothetical protein
MKIKKHVIATESQVLENQLRPGNRYTALADKDGFLNPAIFAWACTVSARLPAFLSPRSVAVRRTTISLAPIISAGARPEKTHGSRKCKV